MKAKRSSDYYSFINTYRVFMFFWGMVFGLLFFLIYISKLFLMSPESDSVRKLFFRAIDLLMIPFPNSLYIILFGATSSNIISLLITGVTGYYFFSYFGNKVKSLPIKAFLLYVLGYAIFSILIYYFLGNLFFIQYFMQSD